MVHRTGERNGLHKSDETLSYYLHVEGNCVSSQGSSSAFLFLPPFSMGWVASVGWGGGAEGLEWGISGELNLRGNNLFLIQTQSLFFDARHFFARISASRRNKVVLIYVNGGHYGYVHIQLE